MRAGLPFPKSVTRLRVRDLNNCCRKLRCRARDFWQPARDIQVRMREGLRIELILPKTAYDGGDGVGSQESREVVTCEFPQSLLVGRESDGAYTRSDRLIWSEVP